ncbi:MAG: ABC transporter ATP-binding protein [Burkholderiales bacterium]|nr:ABC transporter ATP-binding protein [Burkholderiales bacterium]
MNSTLNSPFILQCQQLTKVFQQGDNKIVILNNLNLNVKAGETVSIMGSSGSGKSTLLHLLAGLDKASSGNIIFNNQNLTGLEDSKICQIRNQKLGFIYQFHHLLPEFTALENILMPIIIQTKVSKEKKAYALDILAKMGLSNRVNHFPGQLSGGERQRVAIARAVINNPLLIFADEPTGNLDNTTSNQVLDIFLGLQQELRTSLVIVTHDNQVAEKTNTQYRLLNGVLQAKI